MSAADLKLDQQIESIFDKADDIMINKKNYKDAVSYTSY
jgi:hypothetical protein